MYPVPCILCTRVSLTVLYKLCCQSILLAEGMVNRVLTFSVNSNVKYSDHTIGNLRVEYVRNIDSSCGDST